MSSKHGSALPTVGKRLAPSELSIPFCPSTTGCPTTLPSRVWGKQVASSRLLVEVASRSSPVLAAISADCRMKMSLRPKTSVCASLGELVLGAGRFGTPALPSAIKEGS